MVMRSVLTYISVMVLLVGNAQSYEPTVFSQYSAAEPGGTVVLQMSGDLAREYARMTGTMEANKPGVGLEISATAIIAQGLGDNQFRVEHSLQLKSPSQDDRLVTLTATVDSKAIRPLVRTVFEGEFTFADSTPDNQPSKSTAVKSRHLSRPTVSLTDLKGVKLRSWTLESEVGE